jgi:hypothetical protein
VLRRLCSGTDWQTVTPMMTPASVPAATWRQRWVVDIVAVGSGESALKYLSAYVCAYRTALGPGQIVRDCGGRVTFTARAARNRSPDVEAPVSGAQPGMTNRWLEEQGLVSIQALWVSFHYPAKARGEWLSEPPYADPHVRCCGEGELITPPHPIVRPIQPFHASPCAVLPRHSCTRGMAPSRRAHRTCRPPRARCHG